MGPLETFGNKVVMFSIALNIDYVGWKFRLWVKSMVSQLPEFMKANKLPLVRIDQAHEECRTLKIRPL